MASIQKLIACPLPLPKRLWIKEEGSIGRKFREK